MTDRTRLKRDAGATAAGGALGAALMPVRMSDNSKTNPYRKLAEGTHDVPTKQVLRHARRTGYRLQNRNYTAGLARHLKSTNKATEPSKVVVWRDGTSTQINGAHRIWANSMLGRKTIPVHVHHEDAPRPQRRLAFKLVRDAESAVQRKRMKADYNGGKGLSDKKLNRIANRQTKFAARVNRKLATGSLKPEEAAESAHKPHAAYAGKPHLRGRQAAYLAGGAAAGLAAYEGGKKIKQKLSKAHTISAFGVDHGYAA